MYTILTSHTTHDRTFTAYIKIVQTGARTSGVVPLTNTGGVIVTYVDVTIHYFLVTQTSCPISGADTAFENQNVHLSIQ